METEKKMLKTSGFKQKHVTNKLSVSFSLTHDTLSAMLCNS